MSGTFVVDFPSGASISISGRVEGLDFHLLQDPEGDALTIPLRLTPESRGRLTHAEIQDSTSLIRSLGSLMRGKGDYSPLERISHVHSALQNLNEAFFIDEGSKEVLTAFIDRQRERVEEFDRPARATRSSSAPARMETTAPIRDVVSTPPASPPVLTRAISLD